MRSRIEELREEIDELYKRWDPAGLSAEEFHRLDDRIYVLEEELIRLLQENRSCQKNTPRSSTN
jgi:hypothetical protein